MEAEHLSSHGTRSSLTPISILMMGMKGRVDMEPSGNAWSTLGSSMLLPSTLSAAIEQLKLSLRDMSLEHATTTAGLKLEIAELRGELRALGRTSREDKDEFNAFAYVSPEEIGIVTEIVKPDMTGVKRVSGFVVPAPSPLPLILSYKSEKPLCGATRRRSSCAESGRRSTLAGTACSTGCRLS